jgi:hypothetical protein
LVTLRVEVNKLNKKLKSSQVLEDILDYQRSPFDKVGIRYIAEASCKEYENANPDKRVEERGRSTPLIKKFEENFSMLPERKNEEKAKNYVEAFKGRDHGQQE